jgi:hypothetical protein
MSDELEIAVSHEVALLKFRTFDRLNAWVRAEHDHWEWIMMGNPINQQWGIASRVATAFTEIQRRVADQEANLRPLSDLRDVIEQHFRSDGDLLYSRGPAGEAVFSLRERHGEESAAFAYAFQKGWIGINSAANPTQLKAGLLISMPALERPDEISGRLQRERANFKHSTRVELEAIAEARSGQEALVSQGYARGRRLGWRMLKRKAAEWQRHVDDIEAGFADAVQKFKSVEEAYRVYMGLKAPVEYWTDKAREHREAERVAGLNVLYFFISMPVLLAAAFAIGAWQLISHPSIPQPAYFVVSAGLATFAGTMFWIGRMLNRLYLSAHHLRIDADERAVMTQAYLALSAEGAASDAERPIVLNALFRPTADGLVKEDGPDLSIAGAIARLGTK